jgi:5-methylcytosine-specific restriction endonuclease McrA
VVRTCKTCVADYDRARYFANSEAAIERARIWQEANRDRKAEISRRWAAGNRESAKEAVRRWNAANPDRVRKIKRDAQQRRRARQEGAYREEWTTTDILERDGWECQVPDCRCPDGRAIRPAAEYRWRGTVDHIVPLSRDGQDVVSNLRAAHQTCNSAKRAWLDHEVGPTRP